MVDVLDDARPLGAATLLVNLRRGLDRLVTTLETTAKTAPGPRTTLPGDDLRVTVVDQTGAVIVGAALRL